MKLTAFGALVRQLRMQRGIYMRSMADQLGVSESFLSGVEFGLHEVPDEWPEKIAAMLSAAPPPHLGLVTPPPVFEVTKAMCAKAARANVDASLATAPDEILESATAIEALAWLFKWQQVRELHKHRRAA